MILGVVTLNIAILFVIMLSDIKQKIVLLTVVMPSAIMLSVILANVITETVSPECHYAEFMAELSYAEHC